MSQQSGRFFFKFIGPSQNTYMNFKIQFQRQSVSLKVEFPISFNFLYPSAWKLPHPTHISKENSNAVETNQDPFVIKKRTKGKRNISLTFFVPLPLRFSLSFLYLDRKNLASVVSSKVDRMQRFHFSCQNKRPNNQAEET